VPAAEFPEFFADDLPPPEPPDLIVRRRTWPEIFRETIRIYRGGFWRFMLFGLLTAVPMFVMQWYFPRIPMPDVLAGESMPAVSIPPICWIMFLLVILLWPISTAGFQFVADDVLRRRQRSFAAQFSAAIERFGKMLGTGLLVYFSYFFWFFVPLTAMIALLSGGISAIGLLLYLVIGAFMVYMQTPEAVLFPRPKKPQVEEQQNAARQAREVTIINVTQNIGRVQGGEVAGVSAEEIGTHKRTGKSDDNGGHAGKGRPLSQPPTRREPT